jgi:putative ABC transport system substrate-binding protein
MQSIAQGPPGRRTRRRVLLAGAAALSAFRVAFARSPKEPYKVGLLMASVPPPRTVEAFREGLRQRGYVEDQNLTLDVRPLRVSSEQDSQTAADMAASGVDVIAVWGTRAALAAKRATSTIPIVIVSAGDPISSGLVRSLARPGDNVTGLASIGQDLVAKQIELFIEVIPGPKRIGVVQDQLNPASVSQSRKAQEVMREFHLAPQVVDASSAAKYEKALLELSQNGVEGVFFVPGPSTLEHRRVIAERAIVHRLPTMFLRRENVEAGGLMSYGPNLVDQFRQAAGYVDRILKGAKPADLPVEQPTKFDLAINLKTAKALGLAIPQSMLQRAHDLIE